MGKKSFEGSANFCPLRARAASAHAFKQSSVRPSAYCQSPSLSTFFIFPNQVASSFLCDLNMVDFDQVPSLVTSGDTWWQIYICLLKHRHRPPVTFWHQMVAKKGRRPDRRLGRPNQLIVWNVDQSRHLLLLNRPPNHQYFWGWSISMLNKLLCFPILR